MSRIAHFRLCAALFVSLWSAFVSTAALAETAPPPAAALGWDKHKQGEFVMALLQDSRGDVWAGTEDKGVWRYSAASKTWTNYSLKDGLGDDTVYALAEDRRGRIWAGTLRNGVSVFNGKEWHNYGLLDGPVGERVFAISACPSDGDVWIATNAGLSRYSLKKDIWTYYTRAEGLPSDQIQAIAFDSLGNIYAGTQCDGLAIAKGAEDYKSWQRIPGPERMPRTCVGTGLPSSQINDVMVADDETVFVATPCGLARSKDFGATWTYVRGADWEAKVSGLRARVQPEFPAGNLNRELLREDYVTSLAEDKNGVLLLGYRVKGYEYRRPLNDRVPYVSAKREADQFPYVSTVLPLNDGSNLLANYGDGLTQAVNVPAYAPTDAESDEIARRRGWKEVRPTPAGAPLPIAAPPPARSQLVAIFQATKAIKGTLAVGSGLYEGDDWRTQGDWIGRYGSRLGVLCASSAPLDLAVANDLSYRAAGFMGPGFRGNSLRHWIHWKTTENPRVLYVPHLGYRREAEWDDNGEAMPLSIEGPDVWAEVTVPAGTHRLSTYYFNKDGHGGMNRMRDYLLELKRGDAKTVEEAEGLPTQATARVRDFWGGVYKRFVVQGPGTFWLKVGKNNSFNTILCGIFLDKTAGPPTSWEQRREAWVSQEQIAAPQPPNWPALAAVGREYARPQAALQWVGQLSPPDQETALPLLIWSAMDQRMASEAAIYSSGRTRLLAYRALGAANWGAYRPTLSQREQGATGAVRQQLTAWRWLLPLWSSRDRQDFASACGAAYQALIASSPSLAKAHL